MDSKINNKIEITICLGSSCFARGNKKTVKMIENYIKEKKIENKIYYHGAHCCGQCEKGPIIKINNQIFENITPDNVIEILEQNLQFI